MAILPPSVGGATAALLPNERLGANIVPGPWPGFSRRRRCGRLRSMTPFAKPYTELSLDELYEILRVRAEVFVVGQRCFYLDPP